MAQNLWGPAFSGVRFLSAALDAAHSAALSWTACINPGVEVILMMLGWRTSKEREEVRDTVRRDLGAAKTKGT